MKALKRTKKPGTQEKKKTGPASLCTELVVKRAYKLCLLGLRNQDLSVAFGVSLSTIEYWYRINEDFKHAVDLGRQSADADVAASLFKRAIGYQEDDIHIAVYRGEVIATPIKKNVAPDVTAQIFWLKNRQKELWSDKNKLEIEGNLTEHTKIDMTMLDEQEKSILRKLVGIKSPEYDFSDILKTE